MSNVATILTVALIVLFNTAIVWLRILLLERKVDQIYREKTEIDQDDPKMMNIGKLGMWKP